MLVAKNNCAKYTFQIFVTYNGQLYINNKAKHIIYSENIGTNDKTLTNIN